MLNAMVAPQVAAYFTVGVPISQANHNVDRATEIVTRYLYFGEVMRSAVSDDGETFTVLVRVEALTMGEAERQVTANRDRLMSGLYGSTDPRYLLNVDPSDD